MLENGYSSKDSEKYATDLKEKQIQVNTCEDTAQIYILIPTQLTVQAADWQVKSHVVTDIFFFFGNI